MTIRPYNATDSEPLLTVFQKNVPYAFGQNEVDEYAEFLRTYTDPYFVAEHDNEMVGACGYYLAEDSQMGHIAWIFADPDKKGLGVGSALLRYNLDALQHQQGVRLFVCRTSQVAYRFFEKFGFELQYTKPDFWAPGLDLYYMTKPNE